MSQANPSMAMPHVPSTMTALRRTVIIGLIAFLTVVDLFATQAILPRSLRLTP